MTGALMIAAAGLTYAALTALCVGFDRHHRQLRPGRVKPSARWQVAIRVGGWLLLALSLWISLRAWGNDIGWVAWFGLLSLATTLLVMQLAYAPRRVLVAAGIAGVSSLLVALLV